VGGAEGSVRAKLFWGVSKCPRCGATYVRGQLGCLYCHLRFTVVPSHNIDELLRNFFKKVTANRLDFVMHLAKLTNWGLRFWLTKYPGLGYADGPFDADVAPDSRAVHVPEGGYPQVPPDAKHLVGLTRMQLQFAEGQPPEPLALPPAPLRATAAKAAGVGMTAASASAGVGMADASAASSGAGMAGAIGPDIAPDVEMAVAVNMRGGSSSRSWTRPASSRYPTSGTDTSPRTMTPTSRMSRSRKKRRRKSWHREHRKPSR